MKNILLICFILLCSFFVHSQKEFKVTRVKSFGIHSNFNFQNTLGFDIGINYILSKYKNFGNTNKRSNFVTSAIFLSGNIYFDKQDVFFGGTLGYEYGNTIRKGMYAYNLGLDFTSFYKNDYRIGASFGFSCLQLVFFKYTYYIQIRTVENGVGNNKISLGFRFNRYSFGRYVVR